MKILSICPSIYPDKLNKMMDSFIAHKSDNITMIVITDTDKSITEIFNETFIRNPDYDFYFMCNDDVIFATHQWDTILAQNGKISYGSDGIQNENLCTFPMIDGDIVRALGWLQMPTLIKYASDVIWRFIGKECNILRYCPNVVIEHNWEGCTHPDINTKDMENFAKWLPWSFRDIKKVKEILNVAKN